MRAVKVVIIISCLLFAVDVWAADCEIRVNQANARKEGNSAAQIVAVLSKGEIHSITDDVPYWYEVQLANGTKGWVAKSLCRLVLAEEEEENEPAEIGQPLSELYALPAFAPAVTPSNCTPSTLTACWPKLLADAAPFWPLTPGSIRPI
jgi:hypothetical protein